MKKRSRSVALAVIRPSCRFTEQWGAEYGGIGSNPEAAASASSRGILLAELRGRRALASGAVALRRFRAGSQVRRVGRSWQNRGTAMAGSATAAHANRRWWRDGHP